MTKSTLIATKKHLRVLFLIATLFTSFTSKAQLGFCKGNSGDPIFIEDFGAGKKDIRIPSGSTSYKFTPYKPTDGCYKVSYNSDYNGWFSQGDHTPGDTYGRALIVNASHRPGRFFKMPVSGLCENTTYEFSAWLINLFPLYRTPCSNQTKTGKPINVTFEIWDSKGKSLLKEGSTGNIKGTYTPNWQEYGLVFKTKPGQTSVILKMRNNGSGGCGNDLAIDDIVFKTCGDAVIIEDTEKKARQVSLYQDELPYSGKLKATPDFTVFSEHYYQWQKSENGVDWINIPEETKNHISVNNIRSKTYYRVLVAEGVSNLLNSLCNSASEVFKINVLPNKNPNPPIAKTPSKTRRKTISPINLTVKGLNDIKGGSIDHNINKLTKEINKKFEALKGGIKSEKEVIIVKDGNHIIYDKVWIDGAIGKFVQTEEKLIKQGDPFTDTIVKETIYYKTVYGYNSIRRIYITKVGL